MHSVPNACTYQYYITLIYPTDPSSYPLLPAVIILVVVVLLLITCVALLVLALAVTATKVNFLRAEKGRNDPPHYYNQTRGGEGKTMEGIYDEVGEGTCPIEGQRGHYQELKLHGDYGRETVFDPNGKGYQC